MGIMDVITVGISIIGIRPGCGMSIITMLRRPRFMNIIMITMWLPTTIRPGIQRRECGYLSETGCGFHGI